VLAIAVAVMGLIDLASAALSHPSDRLRALYHLVPSEVLDTSRTFTLLAGALLLVTAWGLARGKRRSFVFALFLCAVSVPVNMLKAFDLEEATVAVAMMFVLALSSDAFRVGSRALRWSDLRSGATWAVIALLAYAFAGSALVGQLTGRPLSPLTAFRQGGSWMFGSGGPGHVLPHGLSLGPRRIAEWYLRSLPTLGITLMVGLMILALRPASRRLRETLAHERAEAIVREHGCATVSAFALGPGTDWFFSRTGRAMIAYRHVADVLLAMGDPMGAPEELAPLLRDFAAFAESHDWIPAFYQATPQRLPLYQELGWRAVHIGEEPILEAGSFTLKGGALAEVRRALHKADRAGLEVRFFHPRERRFEPGVADHALFLQLHDVSEQWCEAHPGGEMDLGMGRFSAERLQQAWLAVAVRTDTGRAEAFMTWEAVPARHGWTLDLMRRRSAAPPGTMELLVVRSVEAAAARGDAMLSLALSALVRVPGEHPVQEDSGAERAREFLRQRLAGFYDFDGLFRWKRKFAPRFEERYLIHPSAFALPGILLALARTQSSGGWGHWLQRALSGRGTRVGPPRPAPARSTA
jgi:lysylphosphatidylglycerol synthetase-like protein (DUF2156 family)